MGEEFWKEVEGLLSTIQGNLGICCQDYCDAASAMHAMDNLMDKLIELKEKTD